ncbi:CoA pyrophosphatase [Pararhizobium mangrovi]|uniref:CoA pyrophosphatase n=1 Tax=Pararhizobium mangrovi TaxID=2590452 RepID=A0A506UHS9_9HYPH|nr:CoA pyrophosphatase [Pararhizobium mangrovi]TPW32871.1 CoA pyrophosphatase [Pararhizobium mangrovi]
MSDISDPGSFTAADFRRRIAKRGSALSDPSTYAGDHRLNPSMIEELEREDLRHAAVLVPVIDTGAEARIILTQRTTSLRKHSGQIAFPGGGIDPGDASPEAAALREANEEIGLDPSLVETLARLPDYLTATGFRITPVIALVDGGFSTKINPAEVAAVFEVPLSFVMDARNHGRGSREWKGKSRHFFTMPYGEWFIWGITAGIIRTLYERLYA